MIDIFADLQKIKKTYETTSRNFSALVSGDSGTGKTTLLMTARRPIYIYQFDPDGARSIRDEIDWKSVFVDSRFDHDDPKLPIAYQEWGLDFLTKKNTGFFKDFGTVAIDSLTTFSDIIMYNVLKLAGRIGQIPRARFGKAGDNDYVMQMNEMSLRVREFMTLPCDFFATCHLETEQDGETMKIKTYPLITGKLKTRIPLLFTDIFVCITKNTAKGIVYELLTRNDGNYLARTKTGRHNIFETYERQDIKYLLKKANLPHDDKPPINIDKREEIINI